MDKQEFIKKLPLIIFLMVIIGPLLGKNGFFVLLAVVAAIFIFKYLQTHSPVKGASNMAKTIDLDSLKNTRKVKRLAAGVVLFIFLVWLFFASIQIVEAGFTGVYSLFGKVRDRELSSGFHLVIPLAKVTRMSIRTEEYTMSIMTGEGRIKGADAITALTKEGLNVDLDITVLYRLMEEKASDVYEKVGLNYEEKIIRPAIRSTIREVIAQYEAKDIYSEKRQEAARKISEGLKETIGTRGIEVEEVLLRNVKLPTNLANAIQEKLQAEQEAQKYDFILQKEEKEKERKIIEAEGQRESQSIINQSLTTNYLYYLYIRELRDREGTIYVPTNPSTGMPLFRDIGR